jgi:predicted transcriptional regulator
MTVTYMTRAKSWSEVKETLSGRQSQVLEALIAMEKGTSASELAMKMWNDKVFYNPDRNNVHPRLNELVALGFVYVTGKRACSLTGKTVAVYKSVIR